MNTTPPAHEDDPIHRRPFAAEADAASARRGPLTPLDRLLVDAQNALGTVFGSARAERANPGAGEAEWDPLESTCRHASLSIL